MAGADSDNRFDVVDPASKEYQEIAAKWDLPCPILEIRKVNNPRLRRKYEFTKSEISEQVGEEKVNEEMLWHGTSGSTAEIIATEGFDHRVGVKNGRAYGDGIYFTRDAVLALRYGLGNDAYKKMKQFIEFQSVALSRFVVGTPSPFVSSTASDANFCGVVVNVRYQNVSFMKEYETKSFEELRMEDYAANRRGKVVRFTTTVDETIDVGFYDEPMDDSCSDSELCSKALLHSIDAMPEHSLSREEVRYDDYLHSRRGIRPSFRPVEMDLVSEESNRDPLVIDGQRTMKERFHSITVMPFYANESFEELRIEDYKVGRKGKKYPFIAPFSGSGDGFASSSSSTSSSSSSSRAKETSPPATSSIPRSQSTFAFPSSNLFASPSSSSQTFTPVSNGQFSFGQSSSSLKCAHMIYVRVAVGVSTTGKPSYTRPPPICEEDLSKGRYNSCIGSLDGKSVVVIFENAQVFPEYIVKYEMDDEFFPDS